MHDDDAIRSALRVAGDEFRPNPARLDSVLHRHAKERRRRTVGAAVGAAATVAVVAVAAPVLWGRFGPGNVGPASPGRNPKPIPISAARAVPGGVEVQFTSAFPGEYGNPCAKEYTVAGRPGKTSEELVVTVTGALVSPAPTPNIVCHTIGFDRWILLPTTSRPHTIRDAVSGAVFRLRGPTQPT